MPIYAISERIPSMVGPRLCKIANTTYRTYNLPLHLLVPSTSNLLEERKMPTCLHPIKTFTLLNC